MSNSELIFSICSFRSTFHLFLPVLCSRRLTGMARISLVFRGAFRWGGLVEDQREGGESCLGVHSCGFHTVELILCLPREVSGPLEGSSLLDSLCRFSSPWAPPSFWHSRGHRLLPALGDSPVYCGSPNSIAVIISSLWISSQISLFETCHLFPVGTLVKILLIHKKSKLLTMCILSTECCYIYVGSVFNA